MNNEQKQRAIAALTKWWAADSNKAVLSTGYEMAGVLQEMIDAPEPEQPNQSEQHLEMVNAPAPSVPDAGLVRDAERWLSEHDLELLVTFGMQADDCDADGHTLSKEQTRRLCELGVLRNVGFGRHEMTAFGDSIFGVHFSQGISLPLHTHAEYNAAIERNKQKGGEA